MSDPSRGRAKRVEVQSKVNSEFGSERATASPQISGFSAPPLESAPHAVESSFASAEPLGKRRVHASAGGHATNPRPDGNTRNSEFYPAHLLHPRVIHGQLHENVKKPLRVMKFGGTSVGDASSIQRVVEIVRAAARESDVVVVVSAMSGVTNKLVEAANHANVGNRESVAAIFEELRLRHETAANALISSHEKRQTIVQTIQTRVQDCEGLCEEAIQRRDVSAQLRDAISGLGERLSAPLVAAALAERGVLSEAIEATELVVTDACHGAAEPFMDLTRERCEARLRPLLLQGIVAVVTGFIGATVDGVPTTLGRNSSDFSGTIMGAALDADEVVLWTDVDGILTADPRLVPGASSILEMSYREASELADLGAKVLHPKTMHALMHQGIPLSIRNTFAPERPGTKITSDGSSTGTGVRALTGSNDAALITVRAARVSDTPNILRRALATIAGVPAELRLAPQYSTSQDEISLVVPSALAATTLHALRKEFTSDLACGIIKALALEAEVALVTVIGEKLFGSGGLVRRVLNALSCANIAVLARSQGSSRSSFAFVVAQRDMKPALVTAHRQLQLSASAASGRSI
jgi:bifunctional aspartokinase / homoserine dehydrogenase 1